MNRQLTLNTAVMGILAQNALAKNPREVIAMDAFTTQCTYLTKDGQNNTCAIGQLLPSDTTRAYWTENNRVGAVPEARENYKQFMLDDLREHRPMNNADAEFLRKLQSAHDGAADINDFIDRAKDLAQVFNLKHPLDV